MWWLLILLILVPQIGNAECAWIMWLRQDIRHLQSIGEWAPSSVFDTKKECLEEMTRTYNTFKTLESNKVKVLLQHPYRIENNKMSFNLFMLSEPSKGSLYKVECWPSEIKPK